MSKGLRWFGIIACSVAAAACRHQQKIAPAVAPVASAAPVPATRVEPPANEFNVPAEPAQPVKAEAELLDAFFDFDSATLRPDARQNLTESAAWAKDHPNSSLLIEGHCDERGTEQYNLALGERRAYEAKEYLAVLGVDPHHIKTISYGKDRPFATGHTEQAWAENRRAHIVVTAR